MSDFDQKALIIKFLKINFPICRLKQGNRFKRTIILDDGNYLLSNKNEQQKAFNELLKTLIKIFNIDKKTSIEILEIFLNVKQIDTHHV